MTHTENPSSEAAPPPPAQTRSRGGIPLWIALAGMVVALVAAAIIMLTVLEPIASLIFPEEVSPPLPEGAEVLEEVEDPPIGDGEWLYRADMNACQVAMFYEEQGQCRFEPASCDFNAQDELVVIPGTVTVARCAGTHEQSLNTYSWEVYVSVGTSDEESVFRVFLYRERR